MKKSLRTLIALVLSSVISLGTVFPAFAAAENAASPLSLSAVPEKAEFAAGEEILINAYITNTGFANIEDLNVIMLYKISDSFMTAGTVFRSLKVLDPGTVCQMEFSLYEPEKAFEITEKLPAISGLVRWFIYILSIFTPFSRRAENTFKNALGNFPSNLISLFRLRSHRKLGEYSVVYDGKEIECSFYADYIRPSLLTPCCAEKRVEADPGFELNASITPVKNSVSGIVFSARIDDDGFYGSLFYLDASANRAALCKVDKEGKIKMLAIKPVELTPGKEYRTRIVCGDDGRVRIWLYYNPLDEAPYPIADLYAPGNGRDIGVFAFDGAVKELTVTNAPEEETITERYVNPIYDLSPDPFILFEDGKYYLYATNNGAVGYDTSVSTDLVHWTPLGNVAKKPDIYGESDFWAPEVYNYNGRYYLFYSTDRHLAVATADSPAGPFSRTKDGYLFDFEAIDGNVFFDDDGRIYLYFSRITDTGQQLWGCEMNSDLISAKDETLTLLSSPEGWEERINEGPFMLNHNGVYYLTYSGDGFTSVNYGVGYLTSRSPLGCFVKNPANPILKHTSNILGPGHHCFTVSPDLSELIIVYHCHYSADSADPRRLCIDRAKFVPTESGMDALTVYGPTSTPQPMPKGADTK